MDIDILNQLVKAGLAGVTDARDSERETREAISGAGVPRFVKELFPGVDDAFVNSNKFTDNPLKSAVRRYVSAQLRGELSWEWDGAGDPPSEGTPSQLLAKARDLLQAASLDALATGKIAFFPSIVDGRLQLAVLSGFLWPIFRAGDATTVDALVQVTSTMQGGKTRYEVRRYSDGLLEVWTDLEDWLKFTDKAPSNSFVQAHATGRLPVAFRVVYRDVNRHPEGLVQAAMPAFMAFLKAAVLTNFISELGGFEERVFKSDALFELAEKNANHPLLKVNQAVGPRAAKFLKSSDEYQRLKPVELGGYDARERSAREALKESLGIPDTSGANLTGVSLQEKREAYVENVDTLANTLADALTEAADLAAALDPNVVRPGWRVTLTPHFTQDVEAERKFALDAFSKGALPQSAALSAFQSLGASYVTDAMIERAEAIEDMDAPLPRGSPEVTSEA